MPTLRQRIGRSLLRNEYQDLQVKAQALESAFRVRPWLFNAQAPVCPNAAEMLRTASLAARKVYHTARGRSTDGPHTGALQSGHKTSLHHRIRGPPWREYDNECGGFTECTRRGGNQWFHPLHSLLYPSPSFVVVSPNAQAVSTRPPASRGAHSCAGSRTP